MTTTPAMPAVPDGYRVTGAVVRVHSAGELEACTSCGEPVCAACQAHWATCPCPGPHSDLDDGWLVDAAGAWAWPVKLLPY